MEYPVCPNELIHDARDCIGGGLHAADHSQRVRPNVERGFINFAHN